MKDKDGVIYIAKNTENNKIYIGQTRQCFKCRLKVHKGIKSYFGNAIRKYGLKKFDIKTLIVPLDCLSLTEKILINEYDCIAPNGYNLESGGKRNYEISNITRDRMRKSHIGKKASNVTKLKMSIARTGKKKKSGKIRPPHSEETKMKMSIAKKGRPLSEKHKENMRGKNFTIEHIEKIQEKRRRAYEIICPDGKVIITNKMSKFCKKNNLSHGSMFLVAQGKRSHYKNYLVKFLEN